MDHSQESKSMTQGHTDIQTDREYETENPPTSDKDRSEGGRGPIFTRGIYICKQMCRPMQHSISWLVQLHLTFQ